jgi:Flp pilus assembly protein TadB
MPEFDLDKPSDLEAAKHIMGQYAKQAQQTVTQARQEGLHSLPLRTRLIWAAITCLVILLLTGAIPLDIAFSWLRFLIIVGIVIYVVKKSRAQKPPKE